jgi:PiT family inorganic phosphate transporter
LESRCEALPYFPSRKQYIPCHADRLINAAWVSLPAFTLAFEFTNGWHDAASSIATVVSTRVLRPLWAVAWAAFWNFFAAFVFGTAVAKTMGSGLVNLKMVNETVLLAGLLGAIVWNHATIRMGLPASSSHALMGGYGGAAVAAVGFRAILIHGWILPVIFIFLGPLIGMAAGLIVTVITSWIVRRQSPRRVDKWFRRLQLVSAGRSASATARMTRKKAWASSRRRSFQAARSPLTWCPIG